MESASIRAHESAVGNGGQQPVGAAQVREGWTPADPAPLGLAAFALTTFVLSMFNADLVGGAAQLLVNYVAEKHRIRVAGRRPGSY